MKILRVVTRLNVGGPSRQIQELIKGIPSEIAEQILIVGKCSESEKEYRLDNPQGIEIIKISSLGRRVRMIDDLKAFFQLRNCILRTAPDIIHSHMSKAWFLTIIACITIPRSPKLVHTFHGHTFHSYFKGIRNVLNRYAQKFCASKTDLLISVDQNIQIQVLHEGVGNRERFLTIEPGFNAPRKYTRKIARETLGLDEDKFLIGYIGRLEPIKRPDLLMDIVSKVSKMRPEISFVVAGGGSLEGIFTQSDNSLPLRYLGWVVDVGMFYSAMDLMVLTSDNEGTPLTIIEAGMIGVPTLSRAIGGVTSLIQHDVTGFLVDDELLDFTTCIEKILSSPDLLESISQKCETIFQDKFRSDKFVTNHINVYRKLLFESDEPFAQENRNC
jgi:glycosyltransferase involved in cell wall biosynthesis